MLYESEGGVFTLGLTGDAMLTRSLSCFREARFLDLMQHLRSCDAVFTNLEGTVHNYELWPNLHAGTFMYTAPTLLSDLKWMAVSILSCANNHAFEWGEAGILSTIKHLDEAGLAHAGSGTNLAMARAPAYVDTPNGRLALVALTSTFPPWSAAGAQGPSIQGRPGVSPLKVDTVYELDGRAFQEMRRISLELGLEADKERKRRFGFETQTEVGEDSEIELSFLGARFLSGGGSSIHTRASKKDVEELVKSVRDARRQADWVLVSLHFHEFGGLGFKTAKVYSELEEPADFVRPLALECFAAGADVFVGHGPHLCLGVEVWDGHPIFYSMGNFILENETLPYLPAHAYSRFHLGYDATPADFFDCRKSAHSADPMYWENIAAICRFRGKRISAIELLPLDLGFGRPRPQRGRPLLADEAVAKRIIGRIGRLSAPFGTRVEFKDGKGMILL